MFGAGIVMGFVFDVYRVISHHVRILRWMIALLDVLYWGIVTAFVFKMLMYSNDGQVRLYIFIGLAAGVWTYYMLFSLGMMKFIQWMIRVVEAFIRLIKRLFHWFIVKPILLAYRIIVLFWGFVVILSIFLYRLVIQLLYPFRFFIILIYKLLLRIPALKRSIQEIKRFGSTISHLIRRLFK
ncbi:MAG: spore cortex biosynthesis protein YabQ [Paenibacillus sp. RIFOXYA1_FULL_44_5]|nr:MAG: spore cortex biosynthesis protein YabQ [Paenibacillus sp. RIFOXYA1_FULL_44_5]